ncbi:GXLT2-like protein [Mya arenaria]|uniref:UDP-D-xylose:beta-D-glucoside alpha-1,3-D-xylosyltransferase n=1 Tax=Mya arenaria TaxID=6604 RepID=A0ABY7E0W9_MYAAR|nr:glucoside xylosyltransferase 2-like [Mya arenaria]WAR02834.1 GXLT2-like protein [Mya arenaria]
MRCVVRSWRMLFKLGLTVIVLVAVYMYYAIDQPESSNTEEESNPHLPQESKDVQTHERAENKPEIDKASDWAGHIHIAVVVCGDRAEETLVMFKSTVLFTVTPLMFHIFTEPHLRKHFQEQLAFWPEKYRQKIDYQLYNITFPEQEGVKAEDWRKLFKPCACQRLFIPDMLRDIDSVLYVDTDILFLSPLEQIWSLFSRFNSTQLAAVSIEHEDKAIGWYNRFARHPFYGEVGVNSGVMLMNLTRLRASTWLQSVQNYYKEYRLKITWGDQDLINIYFHYHPDQLYVFSCELNYRPDHCMYMSVCKPAEKLGAVILHGCRRVWFEDKQPAFKAVYKTFKEHYLGGSLRYELLESLKRNLQSAPQSSCGKVPNLFTRSIENYLDSREQEKT